MGFLGLSNWGDGMFLYQEQYNDKKSFVLCPNNNEQRMVHR